MNACSAQEVRKIADDDLPHNVIRRGSICILARIWLILFYCHKASVFLLDLYQIFYRINDCNLDAEDLFQARDQIVGTIHMPALF